jgi:hypothetical protein
MPGEEGEEMPLDTAEGHSTYCGAAAVGVDYAAGTGAVIACTGGGMRTCLGAPRAVLRSAWIKLGPASGCSV